MNKKRVALIAHGHKKDELVEWALYNKFRLTECDHLQQAQPAVYWRKLLDLKITNYKADRSGEINRLVHSLLRAGPACLTFSRIRFRMIRYQALLRLAVLWNIRVV